MIESIESYRRKIEGAGELQQVVKTMKSLAASSLGQYERAVLSLKDYYHTIELGLAVCFRSQNIHEVKRKSKDHKKISAIVFGSDQGLVGQFNDQISDFTLAELNKFGGEKRIFTVGERIQSRLFENGIPSVKIYEVPNSVDAITPLIGKMLMDVLPGIQEGEGALYVFHHRPVSGPLFEPTIKGLFPLDEVWRKTILEVKWPNQTLPEVIGDTNKTLISLINEYIFVSLFQSCAESLASENASRMEAMQRAEKNIEEILEDLSRNYNRLRQNSIDEELFDVVSGFEAMKKK